MSISDTKISRRKFNCNMGAVIGAVSAPALSFAADRPFVQPGMASGDISTEGGVIWARTDQPAQLFVEVDSSPSFNSPLSFRGTAALAESDFNSHAVISGLEAGKDWFYRVKFKSLSGRQLESDAITGHFLTASDQADKDITFCWSGDTVGQGYGLDESRGGLRTYATMLTHRPDFLVHSGDQIYADGPVEETKALDDGTVWRNIVTEGKLKVAQTVQDYRENFYYNYLDEQVRDFYAQVPVYYQWDDHEVINNWYPGQILDDERYQIKDVSVLAANARRAVFDCNPLALSPLDPERIYRVVHRGPLLDLFFLDLRSYRGPNSENRQEEQSTETDFMGKTQLDWLKKALSESTATWKIICSDMPIGLRVTDWGADIAENWANGDGPPLGREHELADLFTHIASGNIHNVHFITADVHFCASYHYAPERAVFKNFQPFWEFISGPLHAGTFTPSELDNTFGPEEAFCGVPHDLPADRPPSDGYQFFGKIEIDHQSRSMTVTHYNVENTLLWSLTLEPEGLL